MKDNIVLIEISVFAGYINQGNGSSIYLINCDAIAPSTQFDKFEANKL